MTFSPADRAHFEELRRKKRVHFKGTIKNLGDRKYDEYSGGAQADLINEPWKTQAKEVAADLTERASRCCRRNEASWRFACEPVIFARMNADIACPKCRGRLWRSEIEVSWDRSSRSAADLKRRQESRRPCRCLRSTRSIDGLEAIGLNRIFTHREDELILHSSDLNKELSKDQRPDRIYGLRQTRNFEEALYSHVTCESTKDDTLVRDLVNPSPMSLDGDPLLFPFLILEAKSGKSEDDWHSTKLQTAFPIRACLDVQNSVNLTLSDDSQRRNEPLVWFFMSKGEDWQLSAAYIQPGRFLENKATPLDYHIIDLWHGSILTKNGALQLLLIVDYIFDWARDTYRQDILTELRTLSGGIDAPTSIFPDTDLMSTQEIVLSRAHDHHLGDDVEEASSSRVASHPCDSSYGAVRHATCVENRLCVLFITRDNVQTLLKSISPNVVQLFSRWILAEVSKRVFEMDVECLDAMEEQWTGTARLSRSFGLANVKFFTAFTFATFVSPDWELIRELCVIAVAEDAWDSVVEGSKLQPSRGNTIKPSSSAINKANAIRMLSHFQDTTCRQTLLAAIKRILLRYDPPFVRGRDEGSLILADGTLRNIVDSVYRNFKKGVLEPAEPFLRSSSRLEQFAPESGDGNLYHLFKDLIDPWNNDLIDYLNEDLLVSQSGAVLICGYSGSFYIYQSHHLLHADNAIYFVGNIGGVLDQSSVAAAIKDTFENFDVYHTTRNNGTGSIRSRQKNAKAPWNLKKVYGIDRRQSDYLKWLTHLNPDVILCRQGSPRNPDGSGDHLFSRNLEPWSDHRFKANVPNYFLLYKLITTELLYWRGVAQKRKMQGLLCCKACAGQTALVYSSGEYMCSRCLQEIQSPAFPRWVSDILLGDKPVRWTKVEEQNSSSKDPLLGNVQGLQNCISTSVNDILSEQEQSYKDLGEYPDLDKEFGNMHQLYRLAYDYSNYKFAKAHKRKRDIADNDA